MDPGDCKGVRANAVSGVVLPEMDADEPAWLSFVISRYLDEAGKVPGDPGAVLAGSMPTAACLPNPNRRQEWLEQPVHKEIGDAVAKIYTEARESGATAQS